MPSDVDQGQLNAAWWLVLPQATNKRPGQSKLPPIDHSIIQNCQSQEGYTWSVNHHWDLLIAQPNVERKRHGKSARGGSESPSPGFQASEAVDVSWGYDQASALILESRR